MVGILEISLILQDAIRFAEGVREADWGLERDARDKGQLVSI